MRVLIVDDEPLARERLRELIAEEEEDVTVVGECGDGASAVAALLDTEPDVVLLDIELPEMDGFEVLERVRHRTLPVVVFITAYQEHTLRAFEVHALDYLLKPFSAERLREALRRARDELQSRTARGRLLDLLDELGPRKTYQDRFLLKRSGRFVNVAAGDVECMEADGNYVRFHVKETSFLARETMRALEERLDPARFVRIHRSWIVNLERLREVQPVFHGDLVAVMESGRRVPVGRGFRERLDVLIGR